MAAAGGLALLLRDVMSATRRMIEQLGMGDRMLRSPSRAAGIEPEEEA